jgi:hypothetical protein
MPIISWDSKCAPMNFLPHIDIKEVKPMKILVTGATGFIDKAKNQDHEFTAFI